MGRNNDLTRLCAPVDLLDQLRGGLSAGLSVARIDGDDLRVQKLHQRRAADARHLQTVDTLLLQIFTRAQRQRIRGAHQRGGLRRQDAGDLLVALLHAQPRQEATAERLCFCKTPDRPHGVACRW